MKKKFCKAIELCCEEDSKMEIASGIRDCLEKYWSYDYKEGNVIVDTSMFESVVVVVYEGCSNVSELTKLLTI